MEVKKNLFNAVKAPLSSEKILRDVTNSASKASKDGKITMALSDLDVMKAAYIKSTTASNVVNTVAGGESACVSHEFPMSTGDVQVQEGYERFMSVFAKLQSAQLNLKQSQQRLQYAEQTRMALKEERGVLNNNKTDLSSEIDNSKEILSKLNQSKMEMTTVLSEKCIKRDQARMAYELQAKDFESQMANDSQDGNSIYARSMKKVDNELADRDKTFVNTMSGLDNEYQQLSALFEGMKAMNSIENIETPDQMIDNNMTGLVELPITVTFTTCLKVIITLVGESLELDNIEIVESDFPASTLQKIISECKEVAPPNDLRHAVFCLTVAPLSASLLSEHGQLLRKRTLVSSVGLNSITFTVPNGIVVKARTHMCYPHVPSGIMIESLSLSTNTNTIQWTSKELNEMAVQINNMCFGNVFALYEYLLRPDVLGGETVTSRV